MLTAIGRYLRKLRIDRGELLKNMADNLSVTASYLSAVENGKRSFPSDWEGQIVQLYELSSKAIEELQEAIIETADSIKVRLGNKSGAHKSIAFAFARKFEELDDDEVERIRKILEGKD